MMQNPQYQQVQVQQPPVTVVSLQGAQLPTSRLPDKFQSSALSQMKGLCITQIVMGVLCMIIGIVLAVLDYKKFDDSNHDDGIQGYGIWCGIYFIIVGGVGMSSIKFNSNNSIIVTMILNIICSVVFCWVLLGYSSAGLSDTGLSYCNSYSFGSGFGYNGYNSYNRGCDDHLQNTYYAMDSILLIMSVGQFVVTIWCAALCCGAVCDCCKSYAGGPVVRQQVITTYPITQTGITIQQGYPVGVHQAPVGGYVTQPMYQPQAPAGYAAVQAPAGYAVQPQAPAGYAVQSQAPTGYSVPAQPQGPPGYPGQAPVGYQPPPAYHSGGEGMK